MGILVSFLNITGRFSALLKCIDKNGMYYIISYMKQVASPGSMHNTGCLGLVHWDDPEGWYGEGGGFRMGNTCMPVADSFRYMAEPIQYCTV